MTVASEIDRSGPYNGNGVTTVFNYGFRIIDENHVKVIKRNAAGVETTLTIYSDYIVSGVGNDNGGQIATTVAPAVGETITNLRNVPFTQETDLENQGPYYAETVETALDLAAMRDQQLKEVVDRAVTVPSSAGGGGLSIAPLPEGHFWKSDGAGGMIDGGSADDIANAEANAAAAAASAEEASHYADLAKNNFVVNRFKGDGSTTAFTLTAEPGSTANTFVAITGLLQQKDTYSVVGTTLTFDEAPPGDGTAENIEVSYGSTVTVGTPSDGTVNSAKIDASDAAAILETLGAYSSGEVDTFVAGVKGTSIASASSIDLGAADGDFVDITGTTAITSFGAAPAGVERTVRFTGALTLTHNATSLILYNASSITTYSGLVMRFRSLGGGNWIEVSQTPAVGKWTPAISFGGATTSITYDPSTRGYWVRHGKRVTISAYIKLTSKGTATGVAGITGQPWSSIDIGAASVGFYNNFSGLTGAIIANNLASQSIIYLYQTGATGAVGLTDAVFTNTSQLLFSMTYEIA